MISKLFSMVRLWLNPPPSEIELRLLAILERQTAELAASDFDASRPVAPHQGDDRP